MIASLPWAIMLNAFLMMDVINKIETLQHIIGVFN
jgi:hypothetical protein